MSNVHPGPGLRGRSRECETLDRLLEPVRAGQSRVLVVRGEAGVGKTALLGYLAAAASGFRIARAAGVESEMELAFAGVHQLCAPMLGRLTRLPGPQRDAVGTAFGLSAGEAPDLFLVGLAVLGLLSDVAGDGPLVCLVDDAQWLDRASARVLAFVARRLLAESVALVFAVREPSDEQAFQGLPVLAIEGLGAGDARALLESTIPGRVDERVRDRFVAETRGNPLALLELPRSLTAAELAGGFAVPDARPLANRIEQSFLRRLESLPVRTRQLLLAAAAEPAGDVTLLWRAAERLGIGTDVAAPAEAAGLIEFGRQVRFRHPLVRSAVYRAAAAPDRRDVHRALAEAIDANTDPDRRAWHRAHAAVGPDEAIARELERSADRAHARGGLAAAAAFLDRAATLSGDATGRATRALAAAQAKYDAGAFNAALELLKAAELGPLDNLGRARAQLVRGRIAFASRSVGTALPLLLTAAKRLEALDPGLARETYRDAFFAALTAGRLASTGGMRAVAEAVRSAPPLPRPPRAPDLLLGGLAVLTSEGYAAGAPMLKQAVRAFRDGEVPGKEVLRWLALACRMAHDVWDDEAWDVLSARLVDVARDAGALAVLPHALLLRHANRLFAGEFAVSTALVEEVATVCEATGSRVAPYGIMVNAAWEGDETATSRVIEAATDEMVLQGEGQWLTATQWATALLYNGLGRYEEAYAAAEQAGAYPYELGLSNWALVELIEAAARSGKAASAAGAIERLSEMTHASATDWALGVEARSRALLSRDDAAEPLYRDAIARLERARVRPELARAHLVYGEWLRREGRRVDARAHLRIAYEMLDRFGAEAFAERARRELVATGETVRKRTTEARVALTAQEAHVARLAADGHTNAEIGSQLFISPRTAEYHLRKVFAKLGISSRRELRVALQGPARVSAHQ